MYKECKAHPDSNTEKHHQCISQTGNAGKIVLIRHIPQPVCKRNSRNEQNKRTDHHIPQIGLRHHQVEQNTQDRTDKPSAYIPESLRQIRGRHLEHKQIQNQSRAQRSHAIEQAASEYDTEACTPQTGTQELLPHRLRRQILYPFQHFNRLRKRNLVGSNFPGELIHFHHLFQTRTFHRDKLRVGIRLAGSENTIAQDKKPFSRLAIIVGNPLHGFLHSGYLRPVFKKDTSGVRSKFQNIFAAWLFHIISRVLFHTDEANTFR